MERRIRNNIELQENFEENHITQKNNKKYKTEKCKVLSYNRTTKELDINFKGYGIRLNNIGIIESDFITIKYYGEIGKPNFSCKL